MYKNYKKHYRDKEVHHVGLNKELKCSEEIEEDFHGQQSIYVCMYV